MIKRLSLFILCITWPILGYSQTVAIKSIRLNHLPGGLQYVIDLTGMVPVTNHLYHHPYRRVFSFYHAINRVHLNKSHLINAYVTNIKFQHVGSRVSLGLHLHKTYPVHAAFWSPSGNKGFRYVINIDTHAKTATAPSKQMVFDRHQAISQLNKEVGPTLHHFIAKHLDQISAPTKTTHHLPTPAHTQVSSKASANKTETHVFNQVMQAQKKQEIQQQVQLPLVSSTDFKEQSKRYSSKIIVVIDAGHGGKDPGATGAAR